jgi:diguanylate cyclase (GGDEF)-like protein/PAS domain S-box-containing protein
VESENDIPSIGCIEKTGLRGKDPSFYQDILYHISDGVYFVDRERRILYWNGGAANLTGYQPSEIVGKFCYDNILAHVDGCGTPLCDSMCPLSAALQDGKAHNASVFLRHKQGHRLPVAVRVQPIRGRDGSIEGAVETFSNNLAQVAAERRLDQMKRMAFIDHLTQLPNRRYLEMISRSAHCEFRAEGVGFGVLLIDVDRFKSINDTFGHTCGDTVLQEIGKTLISCTRSSDALGRWGGDEFVAIVRGIDGDELRVIAERCVALVNGSEILDADQRRIPVSISVGAALIQDSESPEELFARADELMYRSKLSGRNRASLSKVG